MPGDVHGDMGTCPGMTQVSQGDRNLPWNVHGDTGTCPGMSQISQGCEDMGIFPRMSPVSQGHGNLPWDMGWLLTMGMAAPWRLALAPWLVGSSSRCTQGCSQGHCWEQGRAKEKRQQQGEGSRSQVPALSPSWGWLPAFQLSQPVEPACRCSSIIQHQPGMGPQALAILHMGQRVTVLSPMPMAALGGLGTRGHRLKSLTWSLWTCPAQGGLYLSFPTLTWTLL